MIKLKYNDVSFVSVQGKEGTNPSTRLYRALKGEIFMKKTFKISLKFILIIIVSFCLLINGNFLV